MKPYDLDQGYGVSRETVDKLRCFVDLFVKWSGRINLVARSTQADLWGRHVADSLQLLPLGPSAARWVDLGSGGGFPGAVIAIVMAEFGAGWVHLVESNQKKAAFLRLALQQTAARGTVHAIRVEDAVKAVGEVEAVSARALAELDLLLELSEPWLGSGGQVKGLFHKGKDYRREVDKARDRWDFDLVEHESRIEAESIILEIGNLRRIHRRA